MGVVREEIGHMLYKAADEAGQSLASAAEGDPARALQRARHALALALIATHDDTMVAQTYFSWEFKSAVYLPLVLPILLPIAITSWRETKRKFRRKPKAESGATPLEVS